MHAALNSSKSCCSICGVTKVEGLIKGGKGLDAPAETAVVSTDTEKGHKENSRPRKTQMKKMQIELDFCFYFPHPKVKILYIKKQALCFINFKER